MSLFAVTRKGSDDSFLIEADNFVVEEWGSAKFYDRKDSNIELVTYMADVDMVIKEVNEE